MSKLARRQELPKYVTVGVTRHIGMGLVQGAGFQCRQTSDDLDANKDLHKIDIPASINAGRGKRARVELDRLAVD